MTTPAVTIDILLMACIYMYYLYMPAHVRLSLPYFTTIVLLCSYLVALSMQQEQSMAEQVSVAGAPPVATDWSPPAPAQHLSE